jgi:hypothetical protein
LWDAKSLNKSKEGRPKKEGNLGRFKEPAKGRHNRLLKVSLSAYITMMTYDSRHLVWFKSRQAENLLAP